MGGFIDLPLELDEDQLVQDVFQSLAARFPGWQPNEAHLEVALVEEFVRLLVETNQVAVDVGSEIFKEFGRQLINLPAIDGAPAAALTTWTAVDAAGYTIPAGTLITYQRTGDELWLFATTEEKVIPPGSTNVTDVPVAAVDIGTSRNGIAIGAVFTIVPSFAWIESIVSTSITSGGVDAETDEEYLDRLRDELTLISPRPILPNDFAVLARRTEGVYRAVAVDGYNPADATFNNERMIAVAAVTEAGVGVSSTVKTALDADLEARREVTFVVNVMDPTYTDITIDFDAVATADAVPADVEAAAIAAVEAYIDPANWGGGDEDPPRWDQQSTLRYWEVIAVLEQVPGLDHVTALTINGGTVNVALSGPAPLPSPLGAGDSSVTGDVVAP